MNETLFSVDVETTSTSTATGQLISIGAVAMQSDGYGSLKDVGEFYVRINNPDIINFEDAEFPAWDEDTLAWWQSLQTESPDAYAEVFDASLVRHHPETAAKMLAEFVIAKGGTDASKCVFAANPASFDWPWIDRLLATWRIPSPFSHRTLCLRSAVYGSNSALGVAERIRANRPVRPHHALDDAKAQADDLREFWQDRYGSKESATGDFGPCQDCDEHAGKDCPNFADCPKCVRDQPVKLHGLIGRTVTHAHYDPKNQLDVIEFDHEYRLTHYRDTHRTGSFLRIEE